MERLNRIWCELMHDAPMWPMHGRYECRACGRHYRVDWAGQELHRRRTPLVTWKLARASK